MLLETYRDLIPHLEQELRHDAGVELQDYDVMLHVSEGGDGRRMTDLAAAVVLSKSGLTSLVDRMEADGLIERRPDPNDRRVTRIHLTAAGEKCLAVAARHHGNAVRRIFTARITAGEARVILEALGRVREALHGPSEP